MFRRTLARASALALALVVGCAGTAAAAWVNPGSGAGTGAATALVAPAAGGITAASNASLSLSWTAPTTGAPVSGYVVLRGGVTVTAGGCAQFSTRTSTSLTCTDDTGLTPNTTYTYTVRSAAGPIWLSAEGPPFTGTTTPFALTTATSNGNSGKYKFSGIGSIGTATITVAVCTGAQAVCTSSSPTYVETVTFAPTAAGPWGPTVATAKNPGYATGTHTATATQGTSTSTLEFTAP